MTIAIEITIDTKEAETYLNDLQKKQIPFAIARTLNESMKFAQKAVRGTAYPKAFTVRNRALPKALTMIPKGHWATKQKPQVTMMNVRDSKTGKMAGEGFINRQMAGASRSPKGQHIAIPVIGPGMRRLKTGKVSPSKRPWTMAGGTLVKLPAKGKRSAGLYQRMRGDKLRKRYNLVTSARSSRKGKFGYLTVGEKAIMQSIQGHWQNSMNRGLRTAK